MSRTAGRTHVTYSCSGMERLVPSSWSSPAPEIFVHFSPGAARHSRSAGGRHGFTAAQANGSHPELYKLHCSKLSRGGRLAGRPRSWRQTNASVDERHCRQSSHCQIARATTAKRRCTSEPMRAAERSEVSAYGSGVKLTWLVQEELHTFSCTQRAACGLNALDSGGGGCEEDASLYERPHSRAVLTV